MRVCSNPRHGRTASRARTIGERCAARSYQASRLKKREGIGMSSSPTTVHLQRELATIASSFERTTHPKWNELMPFKDSIAEFRKRKASFKTIATILRGKSIKVSHDTVARFCWHVLEEKPRKRKRAGRNRVNNGEEPQAKPNGKARSRLKIPSPQLSAERGPRIARVEDL
jgi:hypothetical protein